MAKAADKNFIPISAKSEVRVRKVNQLGIGLRADLRKEDIGILAYMRRNGLEKREHYNNCDATVKIFRQETSIHPQLKTRPQLAPVVTQ